eukprot:CAMPEP_0197825834 /NCGR_PEP_ID=MMETSP1437-20131217/2863_1 /TAXON_ID=49252 ORGANISM="Eucampia antarctica, Strain CCMP1452" /NCGR_SAMPLE_ID=MMETSP1437 /ASSEMBLY_ACC=CAM_ASM_001096 /LENGTH=503 /DNA_ID=CAMNT_0043426003 /DNA_START=169 /DNA_END=1683 /DNA_ORIENTATION=+
MTLKNDVVFSKSNHKRSHNIFSSRKTRGPFSLSSSMMEDNQYDDDDDDDDNDNDDANFEPSQAQLDWMKNRKKADDQLDAVAKDEADINDINDNDGNSEQKGNVFLPSTGFSVSDEIMDSENNKLSTRLLPLDNTPGIARIVSSGSDGVDDPIRYLVSLSPPPPSSSSSSSSRKEDSENSNAKDDSNSNNNSNASEKDPKEEDESSLSSSTRKYVMVDIPPYSDKLVKKMRDFMGPNSQMSSILVTSRTSIHYKEGPAVYVTRKSELEQWITAFPGVGVVMYRLDTQRDCKDLVTQRLDGNGPWALEKGKDGENNTFVETGRPLTYMEWDEETKVKVLDDGETPPDDDDDDEEIMEDADDYTPSAIREKEEGNRILAIYTPGHTFGSVSFVFPEMGVCCSGFTIPFESSREALNMGVRGAGPNLDYRGFITTNSAGISKQMNSARHLVDTYCDRFQEVLPARGNPVLLSGSVNNRRNVLFDILQQYEEVGKIYEELGITGGAK